MSAARTTIFGVGVEASSSIDTMRCSVPSISLFGNGADSRMSGCGIDANTAPGMAEAISSRHAPGTKVRSSTISHAPPLTRTSVAPLLHSAHPSVNSRASRTGITPSSARPEAMSTWAPAAARPWIPSSTRGVAPAGVRIVPSMSSATRTWPADVGKSAGRAAEASSRRSSKGRATSPVEGTVRKRSWLIERPGSEPRVPPGRDAGPRARKSSRPPAGDSPGRRQSSGSWPACR